MIKKLFIILFLTIFVFVLAGCDFKRDNMENIEIYTTNYPSEYITTRLYGEYSKVNSIYPNGIDINNYSLTKKQISDYSNGDLYIFNGLNNMEKSYAKKMREKNKNLKIIDTTLYMEYSNCMEELWLDPSNFLMMAQNIKKGFGEYINNYYLNNDIDKNYESLKIDASNLDAKIKRTVEKADNKIIITSSNVFKFLEKYGLTVYSLDKGYDSKDIDVVKKLIANGQVKYIFINENENMNSAIKDFVNNYSIKTQSLSTLANISEDRRNANADYFSIMNENIDNLKNELYN